MKNFSIIALSVALLAIGGCATVGKGKGKAPPPAAAPIVTKG
ncbi:MAG TPA: ABC transporter [Bosea sp. (in: a-proteobacteria)]